MGTSRFDAANMFSRYFCCASIDAGELITLPQKWIAMIAHTRAHDLHCRVPLPELTGFPAPVSLLMGKFMLNRESSVMQPLLMHLVVCFG